MNLTTKAILTMGASLVDQFLRISVNLLLTPYIVSICGAAGFGLWQMVLKTTTLLQPFDGRSGECLKWQISRNLDDKSNSAKEKLLSSGIVYCFLCYPVVIIAGLIWYSVAPYLYTEDLKEIGVLIVISILNIISLSVLGVFDGVLRGANIAYKRVGTLSLITIFGAMLQYITLINGFGLPGLAVSQLIVGFTQSFLLYFILKRNLPWFRFVTPKINELKDFYSKSIWFAVWSFINVAILSVDVLLIGAYFSTEVVAEYTITLFASQTVIVIVLTALSSTLPGMGGVLGRGNLSQARDLREESRLYVWILSVIFCSVLLVVNKSFVSLWIGDSAFVGYELNLAIIILTFVTSFVRYDSSMLNMTMSVKKKTIMGLYSLLITLLFSFPMFHFFGIWGVLMSLLIGRTYIYFGYGNEINRFLKTKFTFGKQSFVRCIFTVTMFVLSYFLGENFVANSWLSLFSISLLLFILMFILSLFFSINKKEREMFYRRLRKVSNAKINF
ncbi:oligosaccharide flippase family protein [Vibrio diabolicus]|uniref:oligosaccharide flippase family protein n=1 Tax=Vibrio diabolicus TaxID=50719 RepID=UPI003F868251